jgi:hypothetical protein
MVTIIFEEHQFECSIFFLNTIWIPQLKFQSKPNQFYRLKQMPGGICKFCHFKKKLVSLFKIGKKNCFSG